MAEAKKPAASKKIVDVEHPNTSAPSATSKPVIVTNRPIIQDPMVKEETGEDTGTPIKVTTGSTHIKLQPLTEPEVKEVDKPAEPSTAPALEATKASETSVEPPTAPKTEESTSKTADAPEPTKSEEPADTKSDPPAKTEQPVEESAAEPATSPSEEPSTDEASNETQDSEVTNQEAAAEAEQAKHEEGIQKLIDGKQYFLPINAIEKRRTQRVVLLGIVLAVVLAVAWVDVALDAGLIQLGSVKPVTHFFSN